MKDYKAEVGGYTVEYIDDSHLYLVDGVIVPSITQLLKGMSGNIYKDVPPYILNRAAERGTAIHDAIEDHINGIEIDIPEVRGFDALKKKRGFEVKGTEITVVLGDAIACGRLDLLLDNGEPGIADIKTVSAMTKQYKEYVSLQLNLYRIAYQQSYGEEIKWLSCMHLRGDKKRMYDIAIDEEKAYEFLKEKENGH